MWRVTHFSVINYSMYSSSLDRLRTSVEAAIRQRNAFRVVARIQDKDAYDIAVTTSSNEHVAVRCVESVGPEHITALRTMVAQGPFSRALLVSVEEPPSCSDIACCHIDDVDQALALLVPEASQWT